ncbi:MAG: type II toxin-antitoxin system RelE/ParE family toxin [Dehalococcoidia bacterium]|nr:type II toxin-antitoxin system RelE/ParE family toxin [Dehalococcoidia bacterium]
MEVNWTEPAEAHLASIHRFHSQTSVRYADTLVERLTARTVQLSQYPHSGSVVPQAENIELRMLVEGGYRILYVVGKDHVDILGVLHGSRGTL